MRVLVTGSRTWTNRQMIHDALMDVLVRVPTTLTVVHGECPTGADKIASEWCNRFRLATQERHPADWSLGRSAGITRNQAMVDLGADLCLAFQIGDSKGTRHCVRAARAAGIPVVLYAWPSETTS